MTASQTWGTGNAIKTGQTPRKNSNAKESVKEPTRVASNDFLKPTAKPVRVDSGNSNEDLAPVPTSKATNKVGLLQLPVNVRRLIWYHAIELPNLDNFRVSSICFIHPDLKTASPEVVTKKLEQHAKSDLLPIFRINRVLYYEVLSALLMKSNFYIQSVESAILFTNWIGMKNQFEFVRRLHIRRILDHVGDDYKEDITDLVRSCHKLENLEISFECEDLEFLGDGPMCGLDAFVNDPIGRLSDVIMHNKHIRKLTLSCPCEKADIKAKKHKHPEKGLAMLETWLKCRAESIGNDRIEIVQQCQK